MADKEEQFRKQLAVASKSLPENVKQALLLLVEYADRQGTKVMTDHVDSFLCIHDDENVGIDVSLCIRSY